eukprot:343789_1
MAESHDTVCIFGENWSRIKNSLFTQPPFYDITTLDWLRNNYAPPDNDIFIIAYPKTGTTLTQQICHQIMKIYYDKTNDKNHKYYAQNHKPAAKEWIEICKQNDVEWDTFVEATKNTKRFWKTHVKFEYLPFTDIFCVWKSA